MGKIGRNDPCWCKSGKKYKRCHEDFDLGRGTIDVKLANGTITLGPPKFEVTVIHEEDSQVPTWLLAIARAKVALADHPEANEQVGLEALIFICTAAEAIVNRLLEPLLGDAWNEKFERSGVITKWKRLYQELGLASLKDDAEPLRSFAATIGVRNEVLHFKHGKNLLKIEQPVEVTTRQGNVIARLDRLLPGRKVQEPKPTSTWLRPSNARGYFGSLVSLVAPVLDAYPDDRFEIAARLRRVLDSTV